MVDVAHQGKIKYVRFFDGENVLASQNAASDWYDVGDYYALSWSLEIATASSGVLDALFQGSNKGLFDAGHPASGEEFELRGMMGDGDSQWGIIGASPGGSKLHRGSGFMRDDGNQAASAGQGYHFPWVRCRLEETGTSNPVSNITVIVAFAPIE